MQIRRKITIEKTIAEGGFSIVHLARDTNNFESFAVKEIDISNQNGLTLYRTEVGILKHLPKHRNLVAHHGHALNEDSTASIILGYFPFPTLSEYLRENGKLAEELALLVTKQLYETIQVLMRSGVVHRDIKSDNILINPVSGHIKLIDFGLAVYLENLQEDYTCEVEHIGTPVYMSPAVLSGRGYHLLVASDIWSAGIVLWEMLLGVQPFQSYPTKTALLQLFFEEGFEQSWSDLPASCQPILNGALKTDQRLRWSAREILKRLSDSDSPSRTNVAKIALRRSNRARMMSF